MNPDLAAQPTLSTKTSPPPRSTSTPTSPSRNRHSREPRRWAPSQADTAPPTPSWPSSQPSDYADLAVRGHRHQQRPRTAPRHNPYVVIRCTPYPASPRRVPPPARRRVPPPARRRVRPHRKHNQPALFAALDALPWSEVPIAARDIDTSHGRITTRTIQVLPAPPDLPFPHVNQVWLIERYTCDPAGEPLSAVTALGVTCLSTGRAAPDLLATLVRQHWGVESLHWLRDTVYHEDNSTAHTRSGPRVMAAHSRHRSHPTDRTTRHHRINPLGQPRHAPPLQDPQTHMTILKRPCGTPAGDAASAQRSSTPGRGGSRYFREVEMLSSNSALSARSNPSSARLRARLRRAAPLRRLLSGGPRRR